MGVTLAREQSQSGIRQSDVNSWAGFVPTIWSANKILPEQKLFLTAVLTVATVGAWHFPPFGLSIPSCVFDSPGWSSPLTVFFHRISRSSMDILGILGTQVLRTNLHWNPPTQTKPTRSILKSPPFLSKSLVFVLSPFWKKRENTLNYWFAWAGSNYSDELRPNRHLSRLFTASHRVIRAIWRWIHRRCGCSPPLVLTCLPSALRQYRLEQKLATLISANHQTYTSICSGECLAPWCQVPGSWKRLPCEWLPGSDEGVRCTQGKWQESIVISEWATHPCHTALRRQPGGPFSYPELSAGGLRCWPARTPETSKTYK